MRKRNDLGLRGRLGTFTFIRNTRNVGLDVYKYFGNCWGMSFT
jgi:hypothetical protein